MRYEGSFLTTPYNNMTATIEPMKQITAAKAAVILGVMCPPRLMTVAEAADIRRVVYSPRLKAATRYTSANRRDAAWDSKRDRNTVISTRTSMDSAGKTYQVHRSNEYRGWSYMATQTRSIFLHYSLVLLIHVEVVVVSVVSKHVWINEG